MNRILYSSPHIPRQWIAAHGMESLLLHPSGSCVHECVRRVEGLCVFARAWVSEALADEHAAGIVLAQTCDQMRRIFEVLCSQTRVSCFLFNIPATWQTTQARQLYRNELKRLGRFLVGLGGCEPTADVLTKQMLKEEDQPVARDTKNHACRIPLALAGPHRMAEDTVWLDMIERSGGRILLNCTQPADPVFDRRALACEPFAELADGCFDAIQDVFQRPNSKLYQSLGAALRQTSVKGLIIRRYLWCDLWHAEVHRLKQWAPVPVLDLEITDKPAEDKHRLATRIEAFLEIVS